MRKDAELTNQFLIAMPGMADPRFDRAVALVCEHNDNGAMGLVINHPIEVRWSDILQHLEIEIGPTFMDQQALSGGPVQGQVGFVVHPPQGRWDASVRIGPDLCLTSSRDILSAIGSGSGPEHAALVLGYAGWAPGQLENELAENVWLTAPADPDIVFKVPANERWEAAVRSLGINPAHLSSDVGRA